MKPDFPALIQFFGGYLHQDYDVEYGDADSAIKAFLNEMSSDSVQNVVAELRVLIPLIESAADRPRFLHHVAGCDYNPSALGITVPDWLRHVEQVLSGHLAASQ